MWKRNNLWAGRALMLLITALVLALSVAGTGALRAQGGDERARPLPLDASPSQTLEDILARQRGEKVSNDIRRQFLGTDLTPEAAREQLGILGGASDPDLWRRIRFNEIDPTVSARGPVEGVLIQDAGMRWLEERTTVARNGAIGLGGVILLLALFFLLRGRVRLETGFSGVEIPRFTEMERISHWLLASSFILLGLTGLWSLYGRLALIELIGRDSYATVTALTKQVHNNVAWAFILGLVMVFVQWVAWNLPSREDITWLLKGGGLFSKGVHVPARKFNAGQKIVFWLVTLLGTSVALTGLSLLFPYQLPIFDRIYAFINAAGGLVGADPGLPEGLLPVEDMQLAQLWHSIIAMVMIGVIFAHIYIGTIGMEGAFSAMGRGKVDRNWAREHHSIWAEEQEKAMGAAEDTPPAQPVE